MIETLRRYSGLVHRCRGLVDFILSAMMRVQPKLSVVLLPLFLLVLKTSLGDEADDVREVCGTINHSGVDYKSEFNFEDAFTAKVEAVLPEFGLVASTTMTYYKSAKTLKMDVENIKTKSQKFYDFENRQTLSYEFNDPNKRGECKVGDIMPSEQGFMLLPQVKEGTIPEVSDMFRLSGPSGFDNEKIALKKAGTRNFRAQSCQIYTSCQKVISWDGAFVVAKVTHLISTTSFMRHQKGTVPLQVKFDGKYLNGFQKGKRLVHTFNIYHYTTDFDPGYFHTPEGIVCPNRKAPTNFPEQPKYIQYGQEIHYPDKNRKMETVRTTYDKDFNFVSEMKLNPDSDDREMYRLDDFDTGVSYTVNRGGDRCVTTSISKASKINDFMKADDGKIQMMTPEEFFLNSGVEYHYNGQKHFRGLKTDSWIGKDPKNGHVYEWYFTANIQETSNDYAVINKNGNYRIPYKRLIWVDDSPNAQVTYFYDVDLTMPHLFHRLHSCFENNFKYVRLYVPGMVRDMVEKDLTIVKRRVMRTLYQTLKVSWIRISGLEVEFIEKKGYVTFYLLGRQKNSEDVETTNSGPTLDEAYETLKNTIKDGSLRLSIGNDEIYVSTQPILEEQDFSHGHRSAPGYSSGALAGLGIGMLVLGIIGGSAGGYWFFFKR
ncbi:EF-hand domain-containing protein d1 [Plakobranchus ocellatus]|uniref:EF-hand domain-containing protein d1 n=1 Tax=Plakobranchus ocellatus TaxID=259542 RepID=A0AAV4C0G7_9GAST|nr:EF-hand domain-containing protein d1 [Plakobranchus ocellatus]